jgi:hypothetical protein
MRARRHRWHLRATNYHHQQFIRSDERDRWPRGHSLSHRVPGLGRSRARRTPRQRRRSRLRSRPPDDPDSRDHRAPPSSANLQVKRYERGLFGAVSPSGRTPRRGRRSPHQPRTPSVTDTTSAIGCTPRLPQLLSNRFMRVESSCPQLRWPYVVHMGGVAGFVPLVDRAKGRRRGHTGIP